MHKRFWQRIAAVFLFVCGVNCLVATGLFGLVIYKQSPLTFPEAEGMLEYVGTVEGTAQFADGAVSFSVLGDDRLFSMPCFVGDWGVAKSVLVDDAFVQFYYLEPDFVDRLFGRKTVINVYTIAVEGDLLLGYEDVRELSQQLWVRNAPVLAVFLAVFLTGTIASFVFTFKFWPFQSPFSALRHPSRQRLSQADSQIRVVPASIL